MNLRYKVLMVISLATLILFAGQYFILSDEYIYLSQAEQLRSKLLYLVPLSILYIVVLYGLFLLIVEKPLSAINKSLKDYYSHINNALLSTKDITSRKLYNPVQKFYTLIKNLSHISKNNVILSERSNFEFAKNLNCTFLSFKSVYEQILSAFSIYQSFDELIPDSIIMFSEDGNVLYANEKSFCLFDYEKSEILGLKAVQLFAPDFKKGEFSDLWSKILNDDLQQHELIGIKSSRELFPVCMRTKCQTFVDDKIVLAVLSDVSYQKKTEYILKEKEKHFDTIISNLPGAVYRCRYDEEWSIIYINSAIEGITGYNMSSFLKKEPLTFKNIIYDDDKVSVTKDIELAIKKRNPYLLEYRVVSNDGQLVWIQNKGQGYYDDAGNVKWLDGFVFDITEKKLVEKNLEETKIEYQTIFENTGTASVIIDEDYRIVVANKEFENLSGYTKEELYPDRTLKILLSEDDFGNIEKYFSGKMSGKKYVPSNFEISFTEREGRTRDCFVSIGEMPGTDKNIVSFLDITDRKKMEEVLKESEERFRSLVSNMPGVVYRLAYDPDFNMYFISDAIKELTGYPASEFRANRVRSYLSIIHEDDVSSVRNQMLECIQDRMIYINEYRIITKNGEERWVYDKGKNFYNENGEFQWIDGFILDITERKNAEKEMIRYRDHLEELVDERTKELSSANNKLKKTIEELKKAQMIALNSQKELMNSIHLAAVGETAGQTAHEILNPLTVVNGKISNIIENMKNNLIECVEQVNIITDGWKHDYDEGGFEKLFKTLNSMIDESNNYRAIDDDINSLKSISERLSEVTVSLDQDYQYIVDKIGDISSIINKIKEMGKRSSTKEKVFLRDIILETISIYDDMFHNQKIDFEFEEMYDGIYCVIDRKQIFQSISHLIKNALESIVKAKVKEGKIIVKLDQIKDDIVIKIVDNGSGIDEKVKPYIFEPGYTTKTEEGSTGFGLSISRRFLRGHGGDVLLEETDRSRGACFVVSLPCNTD